jgi:hypothetical protein
MRVVELQQVTEVLCLYTGKTATYPRMNDRTASNLERYGYVVTNNEVEVPPHNHGEYIHVP